MFHVIYKTTNNINGKIYIGVHSTCNLDDNYLGSGFLLKRAIKRYGKSNFTKEILFTFSTEAEALNKEREIVNEEFIKRKDVYNIVVGGGKPPRSKSGRKLSEEAKLKISIANSGRKATPETRKKLSDRSTGRPKSKHMREKLSISKLGNKSKACKWQITNLLSDEVDVVFNLKDHCTKNNINYKSLWYYVSRKNGIIPSLNLQIQKI